MHSLQEARTLGPLCGRSLILRHLKDIRGDGPTPKLRIWGSGVRNLFGRAIYVTGKPSLFRSSRTHRRLVSLRFSLRNSRKIFALVGPRSGGCNPPLSCGGSRPLPSVEMRQRWLQRKWFALLRFRAALAGEASLDEAAQRAKSAASFKGGMRTLGARLMDHSTCTGLFGPTRRRARPRGHRR